MKIINCSEVLPFAYNIIQTLQKYNYSPRSSPGLVSTKELLQKGKAQYSWTPHWGTLFCKNSKNIFNIKVNRTKPVSSRRSTVLSFPFHWDFPGFNLFQNCIILSNIFLQVKSSKPTVWCCQHAAPISRPCSATPPSMRPSTTRCQAC